MACWLARMAHNVDLTLRAGALTKRAIRHTRGIVLSAGTIVLLLVAVPSVALPQASSRPATTIGQQAVAAVHRLAADTATAPQTVPEDWARLKAIPGGTRVVVETTTRTVEGRFIAVNADVISLEADGRDLSVPRADVVRVGSPSHRLRNGILLGLAFALAGAYIGESHYDNSLHDVIPIAMAGGGAAIGAAVSGGRTYYRADKAGSARELTASSFSWRPLRVGRR